MLWGALYLRNEDQEVPAKVAHYNWEQIGKLAPQFVFGKDPGYYCKGTDLSNIYCTFICSRIEYSPLEAGHIAVWSHNVDQCNTNGFPLKNLMNDLSINDNLLSNVSFSSVVCEGWRPLVLLSLNRRARTDLCLVYHVWGVCWCKTDSLAGLWYGQLWRRVALGLPIACGEDESFWFI